MRNQQIFEEAGDWFVRMRDGEDNPLVRTDFMEWLRRSPEHVSAYLDIAAVWMEAKSSNVDAALDLPQRIALARADKSVAEIVPRAGQRAARFLGGRALSSVAVAASILLVIAGLVAFWGRLQSHGYSTDVGEQRSIALRDGSTIDLNSGSRVRVRLDETTRSIELLRGQVLFHVAKDPARPFIVHSDDTAVRAVGTVFDVYRKRGSAVVTVIEGTVVVEQKTRAGAAAQHLSEKAAEGRATVAQESTRDSPVSLRLTAGSQVVVRHDAVQAPKSVNVSAATAWTRRELVFEFTPLGEAAEEFNRYNERQLVVEGERLRAFKITALFRSTDSGSLIRYVRNLPGVQIDESEDTVVITSADE